MALFQSTVLKNYLSHQEQAVIDKQYKRYTKFFHNSTTQENIRTSKEEQFQEGFLRELFVNILGYTIRPDKNFNLTTEFKNEKNSQKADGAILQDDKAIAVIELKGTKTKDLESIRKQAFDYKANQSNCVYVITSNFERLRFYIDNAVDYEEFNLFTMMKDEFKLFWLCLSQENLLSNLPKKIKDESLVTEKKITSKLYNDYSDFKRNMYRDLVRQNMSNEVFRAELENEDKEGGLKNIKRTLFKKSQKLIDRFLFIFFAEDRLLIPANTTLEILGRWKKLKEEYDVDVSLYSEFKKYFNYLDKGRSGTATTKEIFAYNGGLFKPDAVLDSLLIDDGLLYEHTRKLSEYDFDSQIGVNVLGHIFENSLNEIESINAEIDGVAFDKQKSKRKKDGVFYTPQYITRYIVESTVGKLCTEKKSALKIDEEEYYKGRDRRRQSTIDELQGKIDTYRMWLLGLTILDPACGSGAFLNEAMEYLIKEHRYIDELQSNLYQRGGVTQLILSNIENTILENNIFGVDLNEESVEIAKLSLWLRSASPRRKLNDLNNNIKCGNSLISSKAVAGDKAFVWEDEFPAIFADGGFDVVIGNPPYVTRGMTDDMKKALNTNFKTAQYQLDLYVSFMEKGILLAKDKGYCSYIVPNSWLKNLMMSACRKYLLENLDLKVLIPSLENVFSGASVDTMIFVGIKQNLSDSTLIAEFKEQTLIERHTLNQNRFLNNESCIFDVEVSDEILPIMNKMQSNVENVENLFDVIRGINPYDKYRGQTQEVIKSRAYHSDHKKDDTFVPELKGMHTARYNYEWDGKHYISYGDWLAAPRQSKYFAGDRIVFREILGKTLVSTLISEDFKIDRSLYIAKLENVEHYDVKYILGILNSKLLAFYFRFANNEFDNLFPKIRVAEFKKLPIKTVPKQSQMALSENVSNMIIKSKEFSGLKIKFITYLLSQHPTEKLTKKLQNWHTLDFSDFIKELNKLIKKEGGERLSKIDEMEWMDVFEKKKLEAVALQDEIEKIDGEIDEMVFDLYGLDEDERKIVRGEG